MPPSLARNFFEQLTQASDPIAAIRGLINSTPPTFESDWLDFKTEHRDPKFREAKRAEMWSEALGGFSNNQGGVIILGVDARKTQSGEQQIDAASGEWLVERPLEVKSRLIELQRGATDPPTANVEIEAYEDPAQPGKGFVVCFVPEGKFKPYRSEQRHRNYYIRAGDNFVVMSRSMLQAMFYPQAKAIFRVSSSLTWQLAQHRTAQGNSIASLHCRTLLGNCGSATARDVVVRFQFTLRSTLRQPSFISNGWIQHGEAIATTNPIHPDQNIELFRADGEVEAMPSLARQNLVVPDCPVPSLDCTIYCEHQGPQHITVRFDENEFFETRKCVRELIAEG